MAEKHMCQKCGKNIATRRMEITVNGVQSTFYLCDECSHKLDTLSPFNFGFGDLLYDFPNHLSLSKSNSVTNDAKVCPTSGYSLSDYLESGYVGCPDCYKAFEDAVTYMARKMQKGLTHTGKSPNSSISPNERKYNELLKARTAAVAKEDYKLAAEINEQMKKLKGGA